MRSKEIHIYLYVLCIYSVIFLTGCGVAAQSIGVVGLGAGSSGITSSTTSTTLSTTTTTKARYKTMYACEDRQLVMDCDFGSKINLIRANYGRFSITQCNEQGQLDLSTDCMSPITFRIMRERCQDKQKCSVNATSSIFGDKCPKTRKYLEVHFQCQPDPHQLASASLNGSSGNNNNNFEAPERVDVRVNAMAAPSPPLASFPAHSNSASNGHSPILPPNNPTSNQQQQQQQQPYLSPSRQQQNRPAELDLPLLVQPAPYWPYQAQPQTQTVMNSEILTQKSQVELQQAGYLNTEPIVATLRHTHIENMSNPRCVLWDSKTEQWTQRGTRVLDTNATHTTCAFDQAGSYMLVMDYLSPSSSSSSPVNYNPHQQQQQLQPLSQSTISQNQQLTQAIVTQPTIGSPIPDILDQQPVELIPQQSFMNTTTTATSSNAISSSNKSGQQNSSYQSSVVRFFSLFGYLFAFLLIVVALGTIAFIASTMRSSAGAALKSLGNFAAFSSAKYKNGRRSDLNHPSGGPLHNKDLLVINNQNGHQFLYAPANTTKINSSASTHILAAGGQAGTLHHQFNQQQQFNSQQQQMYSANGTLSNLSGTGGQSNNYYYGLMGLTHLFQQQQQQQSQMQLHLSQHHLANSGANQQQQQQQQASYLHQANKSSTSNESANSTPSSSGVESGSASVHQQPQQQQQACLMLNNDYNLMSHHLSNYGQTGGLQQQQQQHQQPTLTFNAHYGMTVAANNQPQRQIGPLTGNPMREHIYECVDDDKPYTARLLLPTNVTDQFNSNTLNHHHHQQAQQMNSSRALTLSSRLVQNQTVANQQQMSNQSNNKRLTSHPAIIRDNQAKTNIICSKLVQVTPQRATEINNKQFQHDVMAIYNPNDTTTTTTNSSTSGNSSSCYSRTDSVACLNAKLSTDC